MGLFPIISGNLYTFSTKGLSIIVLGLYVSHMVSVADRFGLFFVLFGMVVCSFTCFTAFGTYEKHSQLTGHAWLIHEPHYHFCAQPHVGEGWHSGSVCHQGWSSDLSLSRTHMVEEENQLLKIIL